MNQTFTLKDFQRHTADRIFEIFRSGQRRVLLADEVGLGKTIVAREVIKLVSRWHKTEICDDQFKVVYICSNASIATQNAQKLGIENQMNVSESRLSMQHLKIYENAGTGHPYEQLIPLTPATSFSMTIGCGNQSERALMLAHLIKIPVFHGYERKLSRFLAHNAEKNWKDVAEYYKREIENCDKNGSNYLDDMLSALTDKLNAQFDLVREIIENCDSRASDRKQKSRPLINQLRKIFAEISLAKLEPDLVIMDEFQRFRDLISSSRNSEAHLLCEQFLNDTRTKVLLLSATPYKQYSTLEEIGQDESSDHYHEFMDVMNFLFHDDNKRQSFQTVWQGYSASLSELNKDSLALLLIHKSKAEDSLYQVICRSERFNTGIIDDSSVKEVKIGTGDILSYNAAQTLLDDITARIPKTLRWKNVPVDYVKSSPYLLTFMENNYQLKKYIRDFCAAHSEFHIKPKEKKYLLLKKTSINSYDQIEAYNARLEQLKLTVFDNVNQGSETLLWIPPSRPYYRVDGIFNQNRDFSKVIVFSSWEMVPRMISIMLSYEAERLTIGKLFNKPRDRRIRGYFSSKEERRYGIGRLKLDTEEIICLVSETLADLFRPDESLGEDLQTIRTDIQAKLQDKLKELKQKLSIDEDPRAGSADLVACIRAMDGDPEVHPRAIPHDAIELLTEMAIGSPAICAYRMFLRGSPDSHADCARYARDIAKEVFVNLFNKAESSAVLDLLYGHGSVDAYYKNVFRYCVEGNLQSVLDEFAHILNTKGVALKTAIKESVADTVSLPIDTQETFPDQKKTMMRSHYAVGYYNAKVSDDTIARVDRIRKAFNSPFRPFVLSTTSIGQEGLDFHNYCRKVMHWNLPSNPIDLEQREGRINRFKCLAVRQNIAKRYGDNFSWDDMFAKAKEDLKGEYPDLVPYWCLPNLDNGSVKIERIVPMYPFSQDQLKYNRIIKILSLYRLTLGQPRQEELISILDKELAEVHDGDLFMNLSPFYHTKMSVHP